MCSMISGYLCLLTVSDGSNADIFNDGQYHRQTEVVSSQMIFSESSLVSPTLSLEKVFPDIVKMLNFALLLSYAVVVNFDFFFESTCFLSVMVMFKLACDFLLFGRPLF